MKKKFLSIALAVCVCFVFAGCGEMSMVEAHSKNVNNYDISATLDYEAKTLSAVETVTYINKTDLTLSEIKFHLYPNAFRSDATVYKAVNATQSSKAYPNGFSEGRIDITNTKLADTTVEYEVGGTDKNILIVPIDNGLRPNCAIDVTIEFDVLIPNCNHRFGYGENTLNLGNWYPIACVFEEEDWVTDGYSPNGDPFYSDISNYTVQISYPEQLTVASTGNWVTTNSEGGVSTSIYQASAVRDFALVLSEKFSLATTSLDNITVNYYYYDDDNYESNLQTCVDALRTFNEMIGQYPYTVLNVVKTNFMQGGMEYPNLVYISDSVTVDSEYKNVIIHEIAHQWWYGVVGNNECEYAWLDEGLTEYVTALFYDENDGYELTTRQVLANALNSYLLFCDVYREVYGDLSTNMNRNIHDFDTETEYVYLTYVKGVLMFDSIADLVGPSNIKKCLQRYYDDNAMTNATPSDLIKSFESASHKNLSSYIMSWLDGSVVLEELTR